jgi:hypothetical protein
MQAVVTFAPGSSATDDVVHAWLAREGIDQNKVRGYTISRHDGELSMITLAMYFDDKPAEAGEE